MVYLVVPEESILELLRLPKRSIVERLIALLKECDHVESESDSESEVPASGGLDPVSSDGAGDGERKSNSVVELSQ